MDIVTALGQFAESGVLGIVIIIESWVIYYLFQENKRLHQIIGDVQEKRVIDAQAMQERLATPLSLIQKTVDLILQLLQNRGKDEYNK